MERRSIHKTWKKCKKQRTQRSAPSNSAQSSPTVHSNFPAPSLQKSSILLGLSDLWHDLWRDVISDYMLPSTFNDLVLSCLFFQASSWAPWKQRSRLLMLFVLWQMRVPWTFSEIIPWLCSECRWSHPCTQNPSRLFKGIRALRCNLRITGRINKSLP